MHDIRVQLTDSRKTLEVFESILMIGILHMTCTIVEGNVV